MVQPLARPRAHETRPRSTTTIARLIVAKRDRDGLSLRAAARGAGVAVRTIQRLEYFDTPPKLDVAFRIARWLGVELLDLFPQGGGR